MSIQTFPYRYNRSDVKAGIIHFGVGNFHRAHEEYYTNKLLEYDDQSGWGICGAMILERDARIFQALIKQGLEYGLTVCGRTGQDAFWKIGSIVELLWGVEDASAVISKIADPEIKIITLTITEGGYNTDKETGDFVLENEDIKYDLTQPAVPRTAFGYIAEGLIARKNAGAGPITILSCDNLQHNGDTCRKAFTSYFAARDPKLAAWVNENVTFPNSMVDRITPATTPEDIVRLKEVTGFEDEAPVYCEDFIQWVIEDDFIAGRPAWERVGVEFTDDVTAYENMKLGLLNASHQMLSYPSFLAGYRKVDDAMNDARFSKYLRLFMDVDATPYIPAPPGADLEEYKTVLIERFGNHSVSDQLARLCFDGIAKIPVYNMPGITAMVTAHATLKRVTFFIAAYRHYLKYKVDDKGAAFEINDPSITENDLRLVESDDPLDFLGVSCFLSADLRASDAFVSSYLEMVAGIREKGVEPVLETLLTP
ncbi:MAG: mannitol dehydrogenase family protein [Clostridiales Family XIII bacterium]|jgi:mannitol 2-dehydrogenase|nr:mannitol dehydrogenase family protein [Clostridiales Family XIII bacterium]